MFDLPGRATPPRGRRIFYDRPMGNIKLDSGSNAPSVLNSSLQWGQLQNLTAAQGDPNTPLSLSPRAAQPAKVYAWNLGLQQKYRAR